MDGEKAMKERKFESLQKKIMKIKNAKREINEKERAHTHTLTFVSTSGKAENMLKRRVGPRDDKHATE